MYIKRERYLSKIRVREIIETENELKRLKQRKVWCSMRFNNDYDYYEIKDYTVDKFLRFIKEKIKENPRQRMSIILYRDDGDMHEFTVSSHMDYSLGVVVKITPDGCIGKECRLKDSGFDRFAAKMLTMGFNAHY